jgi:hypothetical protein
MKHVTFVRRDTGAVVGIFSGSADQVARNTPLNCLAMEGHQPLPVAEDDRAALLRRHVVTQIAAIEARQARAVREAALGQPGAAQRLQDIDDQITTLREQLQ